MIDKEKCHILIIQEAEDAMLSERFLKHYGFKNVSIAPSSKDALSILEEIEPDLVILNYLPLSNEAPTGIELFQSMQQLPKLQNSAFLIYHPNPWLGKEKRQQLKMEGFDGLLRRPLMPSDLNEACETVLRGGTYFPDWNND
ncbi:MAG: hypothetical protein H6656_11830 [Ardenticatenaceae bacterium]|nr:hypothetical protein [Ardenticatenaceae bacterium]